MELALDTNFKSESVIGGTAKVLSVSRFSVVSFVLSVAASIVKTQFAFLFQHYFAVNDLINYYVLHG